MSLEEDLNKPYRNFPEGLTKTDLKIDELKRYEELKRTPSEQIPTFLQDRFKEIKQFIQPFGFSGEVMQARNELIEDAYVRWIKAKEDPTKVEWIKLE